MDKNKFSVRLKELRKSRSLSARSLSLMIGCAPSYISGIENGRGLPSVEKLLAICKILNIRMADLFKYD